MARLVSQSDLARIVGRSRQAISKAVAKQLAGALVGSRVDLDHASTREYLLRAGVDPTKIPQTDAPAASDPTADRPSTKPNSGKLSDTPGAYVQVDLTAPSTLSADRPQEYFPADSDGKNAQTSETPGETPRNILPEPPRAPLSLVPNESAHRDTTSEDIERYAHLTLEQLTKKFGTATAFQDWLAARKRISDIREKDLKNDERAGKLIPRELVRTHVFSHIEASTRRLLQDAAPTIARRLYAAAKGGTSVEEAEQMVREILSSHLKPAKQTAARVLRGG